MVVILKGRICAILTDETQHFGGCSRRASPSPHGMFRTGSARPRFSRQQPQVDDRGQIRRNRPPIRCRPQDPPCATSALIAATLTSSSLLTGASRRARAMSPASTACAITSRSARPRVCRARRVDQVRRWRRNQQAEPTRTLTTHKLPPGERKSLVHLAADRQTRRLAVQQPPQPRPGGLTPSGTPSAPRPATSAAGAPQRRGPKAISPPAPAAIRRPAEVPCLRWRWRQPPHPDPRSPAC